LNGRKLPSGIILQPAGNIRIRWWKDGRTYSTTLDLPHTDEGIQSAVEMRDERIKETKSLQFRMVVQGEPDEHVPPDNLTSAYSRMFRAARKRDRYLLTVEDERELVRRCGGRCEVSGVPFSLNRGEWGRAPYTPSLDRIKSKAGYTPENCRIVCCAVNLAMNEWGESVLEKIALNYLTKIGTAKVY